MNQTNQTPAWPAPKADGPLHATVTIPGSKSLSNRYLILAALGTRPVTLIGLLRSRDTELMMGALAALGVRCEADPDEETTVTVTPPANGRFLGDVDVYCGLAGTVMRFVPGLALFADGPVRFDGDEQAYARPMKPVLDGLEQLGAHVEYHGETGYLPFTVTPPAVFADSVESVEAVESTEPITQDGPMEVAIDSSGSSQFISGLLLVGSRLPGGLRLTHTGERTPSLPHIRMTVADVNGAGGHASADEGARVWNVEEGRLQLPERVVVEPDLSNAAPFLGAALIAGGEVRVPNWPEETTQPGGLLPGYLHAMGAEVDYPEEDGVRCCRVRGDGTVHGLGDFDLTAAGEIAPSLAAVLAFADAPTRIIGIGHLRGHETNRLEALVTELRRVGVEAEELPDGIAVTPVGRARMHGAVMESYADHRMATFAAMIGLAVPGVEVVDVATTRKTMPDFVGMWAGMLG